MEKKMVDAISLLKSSKYRLKIIVAISNKMLLPSEIAKLTKLRLNHVSSFLKELKSYGLVICLNEENKKGRLYQLTELGKNAISKLNAEQSD